MKLLSNKYNVIKNRLMRSSFIKSVLTISSGIVLSQVISFVLSPIYSRIYTPEVIGDFSIMTSSGTIINSIISLGLFTAVMLSKKEQDAQQVCTLILLSNLIFGTIFLFLALALQHYWTAFTVSIPYWLGCLIVYFQLLLANIVSLYYTFINRKAMYRVLFWNPIIGVVSNGILSIIFGLLGWGLIGYSIGIISASIVNIIYMAKHVQPFVLWDMRLLDTLREYRHFPLFQLPANIISTVSEQLPVQLISLFFGNAILGIYSMTMRFLSIPVSLLATPINRVYYRDASVKYANGEEIGIFTFRILKTNIKLAVIPIVLIMIFGEHIFAIILGEKWRMVGVFVEILGMYSIMSFCSACVSGGFVIIGKQKYNLIIAIISIISNVGVFILGSIIFKDIYLVLICYAIVNTIIKLITNGWFICYVGIRPWAYIRFTLLYIILPACIAISVKLLMKKLGVL